MRDGELYRETYGKNTPIVTPMKNIATINSMLPAPGGAGSNDWNCLFKSSMSRRFIEMLALMAILLAFRCKIHKKNE
jgi:hypothetical protein